MIVENYALSIFYLLKVFYCVKIGNMYAFLKKVKHKHLFFTILIILFLLLLTNTLVKFINHQNEKKIIASINDMEYVNFSSESILSDLNKLVTLSKQKHSDNFKGFIYERLAFTYSILNDDLNYYASIGKAYYYLEKSSDYKTLINLSLDLVEYQYIPHGDYELAQKTIVKIDSILNDFDLNDVHLESYYYRLKGDCEFINHNYEKADEYYLKSIEIANSAPSPIKEIFSTAADIHYARSLNSQKKYDQAIQIVQKYQNEMYMKPGILEDIVPKVFSIPFYQVLCCYCAYSNDFDSMINYINDLISITNQYHMETQSLLTLSKIQRTFDIPESYSKIINELINKEYINQTKSLANKYSAICIAQIDSIFSESFSLDKSKNSKINNIIALIIICIIFILLLFGTTEYRNKSYKDNLTKLFNRRYLSKRINYLDKKKISASVLMLDIDDFKKINDNFGHASGDIVLERIGELLNNKSQKNKIEAFRYGGEEFLLFVFEDTFINPVNLANNILEEIQLQIFEFNQTITVSIGVAKANNKQKINTIIKKADKNLYAAKNNGKNQVFINSES